MPGHPTQPAAAWAGVPLAGAFTRDFTAQDSLPLDGSSALARSYSPFVLRLLLPSILGDNGDNTLLTGAALEGTAEGTVRNSNRGATTHAAAVRGSASVTPGTSRYEALASLGGAVPGLTATSVGELERAYTRATLDQLHGERIAGAIRGRPSSTPLRARAVVPARTGDLAALHLLLQLKQLAAVPPLLLLINPASFSLQYGKIAQHQERTRMGHLYQAWGEELLKISMTFRIGAYYAGARSTGGLSAGMSRASRNDSAAYQQLMALLTFYQSGGYLQPQDGSRAYPMIGNLSIEYDQKVYVGHMDTFSVGEEENNANGGLQAEVEFTAVREFDLAPVPSVVNPLDTPNGTVGTRRGTLARAGAGGRLQVLTAPTVGISSPEAPPQPWAGAVVASGATTPEVLTTRRR